MRGTIAKRIRKIVYNEGSRRNIDKYIITRDGVVICTGHRKKYLVMKTIYKGDKHDNTENFKKVEN